MNQTEKDWKKELFQHVGRALRNKTLPIVIISHDYNHKVFPDEYITIDSFSTIKNFSETEPTIKQ
jgi:hypothetical protein